MSIVAKPSTFLDSEVPPALALPLQSDRGMPVSSRQLREKVDEDERTDSILKAVFEFQQWLLMLRQHSFLRSSPCSHIVKVSEQVASRFCLGTVDRRMFIGVPHLEMEWFQGLPWLHVAIRPGSQLLNLVVSECTVQGINTPYFAISMDAGSSDLVKQLSKFHFIDVRLVEWKADGGAAVSKDLAMTIEIAIVQDESAIQSLLAGKAGKTFRHRSKFTQVR